MILFTYTKEMLTTIARSRFDALACHAGYADARPVGASPGSFADLHLQRAHSTEEDEKPCMTEDAQYIPATLSSRPCSNESSTL